jgi:hypothetical protein
MKSADDVIRMGKRSVFDLSRLVLDPDQAVELLYVFSNLKGLR